MALVHVVTQPDTLVADDVGAMLRCQIVDVTQEDAEPLVAVATTFELAAEHLAYNEDGVIQLIIELDLNDDDVVLTPGRRYTVVVHVDQAGDELYLAGDLITTQSYPLPDAAFGTENREHVEVIEVALTRI